MKKALVTLAGVGIAALLAATIGLAAVRNRGAHPQREGRQGRRRARHALRCTSGVSKTLTVTSDERDAIEHNLTYVNVHTPKNPNGEIRGQVKATE